MVENIKFFVPTCIKLKLTLRVTSLEFCYDIQCEKTMVTNYGLRKFDHKFSSFGTVDKCDRQNCYSIDCALQHHLMIKSLTALTKSAAKSQMYLPTC